jgi:hypothetical protein
MVGREIQDGVVVIEITITIIKCRSCVVSTLLHIQETVGLNFSLEIGYPDQSSFIFSSVPPSKFRYNTLK